MAWENILDIPQLLHNIGATILDLPTTLFRFFVTFIYVALYPIAVMLNFIQSMFGVIYNAGIPLVNLMIIMFNLPVLILLQFIILPPAWTALLYISIAISLLVRVYHWILTVAHKGNPVSWLLGTIGGRD